jgi:hypothetical protein
MLMSQMSLVYLKYNLMKAVYTIILLDMGMAGIAAQIWLDKIDDNSN